MNSKVRVIKVGNGFIQKTNKGPHHAAFGLPFFSQKNHVMPGKDGQGDLGENRVFIPDNSRKQVHPFGKHPGKVGPKLLFDGPRLITGGNEVAKIVGSGHFVRIQLGDLVMVKTPKALLAKGNPRLTNSS